MPPRIHHTVDGRADHRSTSKYKLHYPVDGRADHGEIKLLALDLIEVCWVGPVQELLHIFNRALHVL